MPRTTRRPPRACPPRADDLAEDPPVGADARRAGGVRRTEDGRAAAGREAEIVPAGGLRPGQRVYDGNADAVRTVVAVRPYQQSSGSAAEPWVEVTYTDGEVTDLRKGAGMEVLGASPVAAVVAGQPSTPRLWRGAVVVAVYRLGDGRTGARELEFEGVRFDAKDGTGLVGWCSDWRWPSEWARRGLAATRHYGPGSYGHVDYFWTGPDGSVSTCDGAR